MKAASPTLLLSQLLQDSVYHTSSRSISSLADMYSVCAETRCTRKLGPGIDMPGLTDIRCHLHEHVLEPVAACETSPLSLFSPPLSCTPRMEPPPVCQITPMHCTVDCRQQSAPRRRFVNDSVAMLEAPSAVLLQLRDACSVPPSAPVATIGIAGLVSVAL